MQKPDAIIVLATDGLFSREPLTLPESDALGEWEFKTHLGGTFVQSGIYWLDNAPDKEHSEPWESHYSRGFDLDSLSRGEVLRRWQQAGDERQANPNTLRMIVPATRFMGFGAVSASEERYRMLHRTWYSFPRILRLDMDDVVKRNTIETYGPRNNPARRLMRTKPEANMPYFFKQQAISYPYEVPWEEKGITDGTYIIDGVNNLAFEADLQESMT